MATQVGTDMEDNSMGFSQAPGDGGVIMAEATELNETQKLQLAERANEIYRQQLNKINLKNFELREMVKKLRRTIWRSLRNDDANDQQVVIQKKPVDLALVMESADGFNALCAGDKKNSRLGLSYGARLVKINDQKVENMEYEQIMDLLQKTKAPLTLYFRDSPELNAQWTKAEALKEEANADFKENKIDSAVEKVTGAIDLHPTNKVYYSNRILMFFRRKQYDEALKDCQTIRELDPKSVYVKGHYLRGLTLLHLKRYKNATAAFETVVKLNPEFKKATDRLEECKKALAAELQQVEKRASAKQENLKEMFSKKQVEEQNEDAKQEEATTAPAVDGDGDAADVDAAAAQANDADDKDAQKPTEEPSSQQQQAEAEVADADAEAALAAAETQAVQEAQQEAAKEPQSEPAVDDEPVIQDSNVVNTEQSSNQS